MQIEFDLRKSVDENAGKYFDLAKKAKKKLSGAQDALEKTKKQLLKLESQEEKFWEEEKKKEARKARKKEWYEKFHWFFSSEDFLVIGGKDATSNEIIVKKHSDEGDLVLHTDMAGSPFFVIKDGEKAGERTIAEASEAVAAYSKAWKLGHASVDVFWVTPGQVSKEAKAGESLSKGSFMITGKTTYLHPKVQYCVGLIGEQIIGGPRGAVEAKTKNFVEVVPGRLKKSDAAKKIKARLKGGHIDDIVTFLPAGGSVLVK